MTFSYSTFQSSDSHLKECPTPAKYGINLGLKCNTVHSMSHDYEARVNLIKP